MQVPLVVDADGHCQEPEDGHPRLRVAFMEGGCGWIPFWSHRLDEHWEKLRPQWPELKRRPSEVIKSEQVMYASDYAHWDSEFPESVKMVAGTPDLSASRLKLVLGRNAVRWFDLKESDLPEKSVYF